MAKIVSTYYRHVFNATADRLAYVFAQEDLGLPVIDLEDGLVYTVILAGVAGASSMSSTQTAQKAVGIQLASLRLVTSGNDVGNIAAIGGVGASDSAPIYRGRATTNNMEWSWAAAAVVALGVDVPLPMDLDDGRDITIELVVNSGTTDAATMAVFSSWDGGAEVTDSASDAATKSATDHTITATIDKADVPASPKTVTLRFTPPTHGTNAIQLSSARLLYFPR